MKRAVSMFEVTPAAAILVVGLTMAAAPASANCDWYVKTSLEQQQRNLKHRCELSGPEWSGDKAAHAAWCASVSPDTSRATAQKREASLAVCVSR